MHGFTPLFARLEWITLSHNMGTRTTQEGPPESVLARSFPLSPHPRQKRPGVLSTAGTKKKRMFRYKLSMPLAVRCPGYGAEHSRSALEEWLYICPGCNRHLTMPSQVRAETLADPGTCHEFDRGLVSVDPLEFVPLACRVARSAHCFAAPPASDSVREVPPYRACGRALAWLGSERDR